MMTARLLEKNHELCCFATMDSKKKTLIFAGKSVLLFSDLFQLLAVESPQVYQSPLWKKYFHKVELSENCRQAGDVAYGDIVNRVHTGDHTTSDLEFLTTRLCGTGHPRSDECILNDQCTLLNGKLLNLLPGKGVESLANDVDLSGNKLSNVQVDILNRQRSKGAPPQKPKLKVSARVVVTRNLDVTQGVVNGTLGVVENTPPKTHHCETSK